MRNKESEGILNDKKDEKICEEEFNKKFDELDLSKEN